MTVPLSDYAGYDYKTDYWVNANRKYEDSCEKRTLCRLLKKIQTPVQTLVDAGGGFGRLYPAYKPFSKNMILFDYAAHLLEEADKTIKDPNFKTIQGSVYEMPFEDNSIDAMISIRTLHHLDPNLFFKDAYRVLKPGGSFIIEIPNKRHLLQICRFLIGKSEFNPFNRSPYKRGDAFFNYHPKDIGSRLSSTGFKIKTSLNTSFFRIGFLKRLLPVKALSFMDLLFQRLFSFTNLTPSIFVLIQKPSSPL